MLTIVFEDCNSNEITSIAEYSEETLTRDIFRRCIVMNQCDIEGILGCHYARAYMFFGESMDEVKGFTDFDSTKMLISCNALISSIAHFDNDKNYIINTWIDRDYETLSYLYTSKQLLF